MPPRTARNAEPAAVGATAPAQAAAIRATRQAKDRSPGCFLMMSRFCRYLDKCFHFHELLPLFTDARKKPQVPASAVFASVFALFACNRTSLNSLEKDLARFPSRLRGLVGPRPPSADTIGRVYSLADGDGLRQMLARVHRRLKRNKALADGDDLKMAAVDGHEFFKSRKRCREQCQQRTLTVKGEEVVEYYHQGVVCHLIEHDLAVPLDVELLRPGEGEETAAKRLWSGSSPTTRVTSTWSVATLCTSTRRSSTSAWTTVSTPWWWSRGSTGCCCRTPKGSS